MPLNILDVGGHFICGHPRALHCINPGLVTAPVYQDILEHFMLPSAGQLFKDADLIFQQDLALDYMLQQGLCEDHVSHVFHANISQISYLTFSLASVCHELCI